MATGLKIPVGVNNSGGAAIETNSQEQLKKILILAFSDGESDNPYLNTFRNQDLVFQLKDPRLRARALKRVERVVAELPERVALLPNEPITFDDSIEGQSTLNFKYIDLEKNTTEEFTMTFTR